MQVKGNIDPTLRALGSRARYQILQLIAINLGSFGAAYQLLDNMFIGRDVRGHWCSAPENGSSVAPDLHDIDWNSEDVSFEECSITVSKDNLSGNMQQYPCLFGHEYDYRRELSFRTEFDLVCGSKLLGNLTQTFVILGQGIGAVLFAMVSDRFGRKRTLVGSQIGLLLTGILIGLAPGYPVLALLKFIVGCFQQGVVGTVAAMSIELFPMEFRSMQPLAFSVFWGVGASSMTLFAFLMRDLSWRYLQYTLSGVSLLVGVIQFWYVDESLRWLMTNGKKVDAIKVIKRAIRINGKSLETVLKTLQDSDKSHPGCPKTIRKEHRLIPPCPSEKDSSETGQPTSSDNVLSAMEQSLTKKKAEKLTLLDISRHRILLNNALVIWLAWFACGFSFFTLYTSSTTLHGNRFLNYFLTAVMEIPPGFLLYYLLDRRGRKMAMRLFYCLAGVGLMSGAVFRIFEDNATVGSMAVVMGMVGMAGASGMFSIIFFFTPELFPTNMRHQSLGISSFMGRLGGMIAPFMNNLAEIAVWAPGIVTGTLCFTAAILCRFLPETKGKELPHTYQDIKEWRRQGDDESNGPVKS